MRDVETMLDGRDPESLTTHQWASLLRDYPEELAVELNSSWVTIYVFKPHGDRHDYLTARYDWDDRDRVEDLTYNTSNLGAALDGKTPKPISIEDLPRNPEADTDE